MPPHTGGVEDGVLAKPLKLDGPSPPLIVFCVDHVSAQKVDEAPTAATPSPTTNVPPAAYANTRALTVVDAGM